MKTYKNIVNTILNKGTMRHEPRTNTNILSTFGLMFEHDLAEGFPLLTTKRMAVNSLFSELEWFIKGKTDLRWLLEHNNKIWVGDAMRAYGKDYAEFLGVPYEELSTETFINGVLGKNGDSFFEHDGCDLGPIYGAQWRGTFSNGDGLPPPDQLKNVLRSLNEEPTARRHLVVAWNPVKLEEMVLPPCHYSFQFYVRWDEEGRKYLDMMYHMRSNDIALGMPFNIASFALLQLLVAQEIGALGGVLKCSIGDAHIYESHIEALKEQVMREVFPLPTVDVSETNLFDFDASKVRLLNYNSHDRVIFKLYN